MEKHIRKNIIIEIVLIILLSASLIFVMFAKGWEIEESNDYTQNLDVIVNKNSEFIWDIEPKINIKSIKLDGFVSKLGTAKAFIENNDNKYLILDSSVLIKGIATTGLAVINGTYEEAEFSSLISFEDVCIETCSLDGFDKGSYKFIFEISGGAILSIKSIDYAKIEEPKQVVEESTIEKLSIKSILKKPWLIYVILIPVILNIGLVLYGISKKINGIPEEFQEKLREISFFSNKDMNRAINAYNKIRLMYVKLADSEAKQRIKNRTYKAIEKSYKKLAKLSQRQA